MKAVKLAGVRLINYIKDGINWKDHKDIILDFWVSNKCKESGFNPRQFADMFLVEELPIKAQESYEAWFNQYDFQNDTEKQWLDFVDGTLNIFYRTTNPIIMPEETWYVELMQSEVKAREICESQIYHGNPNINSFFKLDTNSKPEEVGGRRNGYLFTNELSKVKPNHTVGFYWAVAFQADETVKLYYNNKGTTMSKCINWAANCKNMTLLKITSSGRFQVQQIFVEGKAWRDDRNIPQSKVPRNPMTGVTLVKWIHNNYHDMYGVWDAIDESKKYYREQLNRRKAAIGTFNDEEVKIGKLIKNINRFIARGNVSRKRRERNEKIRKAIHEKNIQREREIRSQERELVKEAKKQDRRDRSRLNPLLSKQ